MEEAIKDVPELRLQAQRAEDGEAAYGTARNRTAQLVATLVVNMPLKDSLQDAQQLMASKPVAEVKVECISSSYCYRGCWHFVAAAPERLCLTAELHGEVHLLETGSGQAVLHAPA